MLVQRSPVVHDVVVVGSGASGGMAAYNLTQQGISVLLLDAGEKLDRNGFWTHVLPYEADRRRQNGERAPDPYLSTEEQPYVTPEGRPFRLTRVWGWGGKTNVWGRVSLRMSDLDFQAAERDGWGIPWPIRYADLAPYYDRVEQLIGVCGGNDDSEVLPGSRYYMPPPPPRCGEVLVEKAAQSLGIPVVPIRRANLTRDHRGFRACHYCGACGAGCRTASFFNATDHLLAFALRTGKLEIVSNAVVARVLVDGEGKPHGVEHHDRRSGEPRQVFARTIVVGASCMDTTRILLNSRSERHPKGLGNASDQLGRNYCEQVRCEVHGFLPQLMGRGYTNDDGIGGGHLYIPRFNHTRTDLDYLRGFGIQMWMTGCQTTGTYVAEQVPGIGAEFKREVKRRYPALVSLWPFGETLARPDNRVTLDPERVDRYGVPLMSIDVTFGDNERKMVRHMHDSAAEILEAAGAEVLPFDRESFMEPGAAIHEHGTCRMGADPRTSVLDGFNRVHEAPNLYVVDGSAFTSASEKNPTLTILALAWRASDHLAEALRRADV
ncbi:MAG TPA: GMC family oxidoreductase [Thermoanaerobaculia bacterium]|nr:GMC family oxidoreductase [Thermoanaerobaculia bacterium]